MDREEGDGGGSEDPGACVGVTEAKGSPMVLLAGEDAGRTGHTARTCNQVSCP